MEARLGFKEESEREEKSLVEGSESQKLLLRQKLKPEDVIDEEGGIIALMETCNKFDKGHYQNNREGICTGIARVAEKEFYDSFESFSDFIVDNKFIAKHRKEETLEELATELMAITLDNPQYIRIKKRLDFLDRCQNPEVYSDYFNEPNRIVLQGETALILGKIWSDEFNEDEKGKLDFIAEWTGPYTPDSIEQYVDELDKLCREKIQKNICFIFSIFNHSTALFYDYERGGKWHIVNTDFLKSIVSLDNDIDEVKRSLKVDFMEEAKFSNFATEVLFPSKNINEEETLKAIFKEFTDSEKFQLIHTPTKENAAKLDNKGVNSAYVATEYNDEAMVRKIIKLGDIKPFTDRCEMGDYSVHAAVRSNNQGILKLLDEAGVPLNLPREPLDKREPADSATPFILAAQYGHLGMLDMLSNKNPDVINTKLSSDFRGYTPLHVAAAYNKTNQRDFFKVLYKTKGVKFVATNEYGETPIHIAAQVGNVEILNFLFERQKKEAEKIQDFFTRPDFEGRTPACYAMQYGQVDALSFFLKNGFVDQKDCNILLSFAYQNKAFKAYELLKQYTQAQPLQNITDTTHGLFKKSPTLKLQGSPRHSPPHRYSPTLQSPESKKPKSGGGMI